MAPSTDLQKVKSAIDSSQRLCEVHRTVKNVKSCDDHWVMSRKEGLLLY